MTSLGEIASLSNSVRSLYNKLHERIIQHAEDSQSILDLRHRFQSFSETLAHLHDDYQSGKISICDNHLQVYDTCSYSLRNYLQTTHAQLQSFEGNLNLPSHQTRTAWDINALLKEQQGRNIAVEVNLLTITKCFAKAGWAVATTDSSCRYGQSESGENGNSLFVQPSTPLETRNFWSKAEARDKNAGEPALEERPRPVLLGLGGSQKVGSAGLSRRDLVVTTNPEGLRTFPDPGSLSFGEQQQESFDQHTNAVRGRQNMGSIDVFISHAGPDKLYIARVLFEKLRAHGLNSFLDKTTMEPGDCGPDAMTNAMKSAKVGVFILSPEFAARKWTMRELRCFLRRRREAARSGMTPPTLIPVFYRLSIQECRKLEPDRYHDSEGRNVFKVEKFYSEERQREASTEAVKRELQELADITGIENEEGATNLVTDVFGHLARKDLVERVFMWVIKKCKKPVRDEIIYHSNSLAEKGEGRTDVIRDARHQMGTTFREKNLDKDEFKASFLVPKNPGHVILKFGNSQDADSDAASKMPPEERLRRSLLRLGEHQNVGAVGACCRDVIGMKGMGGIGKSCALRGLALDDAVRKRFCDGIYWLVLGQDATGRGVVEQLARITRESGGEAQAKAVREESELDSAVSRVIDWFRGKTILLLIDDVWRDATVGSKAMARLKEIVDAGKGGRVAFTAREWGLVSGSEEIEFSTKGDASSLEILLKSAGIQRAEVEGLREETERILRFCGGLPLALSVAGRAIATYHEIADELTLKDVLDKYLEGLQGSSSVILDERADESYVYENLSIAFRASLSMMDRKKTTGDGLVMSYAEMYESLVVVQRQGWLPLSVLCLLWGQEREVQARRVLHAFVKASLVARKAEMLNGCMTEGVTLHDLQFEWVQKRCGTGGEKGWHEKLVRAWEYGDIKNEVGSWSCGMTWKAEIATDEYFRNNLCRHLQKAELKDELQRVLGDPRWAAERLCRGEGSGLQEDFRIITFQAAGLVERSTPGDTVWSLQKIATVARLSARFILQSSGEVYFHLYDRLLRFRNRSELILEYLGSIEKIAKKPWLKALTPRLNASNVMQDVLQCEGSVEGISGCATTKEVVAWGINGVYLFRRTFRNGGSVKAVTFKVSRDAECIWSQNGKYALIYLSLRFVEVWDVHTGTTAERVGEKMDLGRLGKRIWNLTGDGKRFVEQNRKGNLVLWDVKRATKIKEIRVGPRISEMERISFSPNGNRLVIFGRSGILTLCGKTGETMNECPLPDAFVQRYLTDVSWSKNGRRIACASTAGHLFMLNAETGERIGDDGTVSVESFNCLSWSGDGKWLICGTDKLSIWDGNSAERIVKFEKIFGTFSRISLSGNQKWVAASAGYSVSVWNVETGAKVWSNAEEHDSTVEVVGWLEDGKRMFSADGSGIIIVWCWDDLESVHTADVESNVEREQVEAMAWSREDMCASAVGQHGKVVMHEAKTGKIVWEDVVTHTCALLCILWSGDNKRVFSVAQNGKVATWDGKTGNKLWDDKKRRMRTRARWSNKGSGVLAWDEISITMWDGKSGKRLWEVFPDSTVSCITWSRNDSMIACGDFNGKITVRNSLKGNVVNALEAHPDGVNLLKWSPDDTRIASSSYGCDGKVSMWNWEPASRIWSPRDPSTRSVSDAHTSHISNSSRLGSSLHVTCLEWSPRGDRIAYTHSRPFSNEGNVMVWTIETEKSIRCLQGLDVVRHVAWSGNGSLVATLSNCRTLRILRVTSGNISEVKRYDDIICPNDLSLLIGMNDEEAARNLESRLKMRLEQNVVSRIAKGEETRLATISHGARGEWHCTSSGGHIALRERDGGLYFYELVE